MEQADALLRWGERDEAETARRPGGQHAGRLRAVRARSRKTCWLDRRHPVGKATGQPMAPPPVGAAKCRRCPASPVTSLVARQQAVELVRQARQAMAAGQLDRAEWLARQAEQLHVPESAFAPGEDRPGLVLIDLRQLRLRQSPGVVPAAGQIRTAGGRHWRGPTAARFAPCTIPATIRRET